MKYIKNKLNNDTNPYFNLYNSNKNIKIYLNSNNIINNLLTRNNNNKLKKNSLKFTVHQKQKIELKK